MNAAKVTILFQTNKLFECYFIIIWHFLSKTKNFS